MLTSVIFFSRYSSVVAQKAAGSAIEWAGGLGFTRETGIEKYWRFVPTTFLTFLVLLHPTRQNQADDRLCSSTCLTSPAPSSLAYRDSKIGGIYEGTTNIQLNTIAKFIQKEHGGK